MSNKHVVAVCGKGGVGKTAYTSMLTRVLADRNDGRLLVVDADPALGLNFALAKKNEKNHRLCSRSYPEGRRTGE